MNVAQLKLVKLVAVATVKILFPRSNERGSIEATSLTTVTLAALMGFHVRMNVAQLKRRQSEWGVC